MKRLSQQEIQKRFERLDTLRVYTEGYESGIGQEIYKKALRASQYPDEEFTGIIRLNILQKDFIGYMLEDDMIPDYDREILSSFIKY